MNKFFTIYKITNKINGKVYIGQHKVKSLFARDNYLGSGGKRYQNAIKKYGKQNFSKEIITIAMTQSEADVLEKYYIKKYDSTNPEKGYNILVGGQGAGRRENQIPWNKGKKGVLVAWNKGLILGPVTGEEYEKRYGNRVYDHEKLSKAHKGQGKGHIPWNKGGKNPKVSEYNKVHGVMPPSQKGKHWYTNGIKNVMAFECPKGFIPGKTHHIDGQCSQEGV